MPSFNPLLREGGGMERFERLKRNPLSPPRFWCVFFFFLWSLVKGLSPLFFSLGAPFIALSCIGFSVVNPQDTVSRHQDSSDSLKAFE